MIISSGVRVFNRSTVKAFADAHADTRQPLFAWFAEVENAAWRGPADIKARYPTASFVNDDRPDPNIVMVPERGQMRPARPHEKQQLPVGVGPVEVGS